MSKNRKTHGPANPQAPKVFVVPELLSSDPVEAGALLKEHLEGERLGATGSMRARIESYLRDPGVVRKQPGEAWPKASELARMSDVERQRWTTLDEQHWIDSSLRKILGGKAAREVFKLDAKKQARPRSAARDRNMCAEVLRLMERCDYSRAEAIERVAEVFCVSAPVVDRATQLWGWDADARKRRRQFVPAWERKLRNAGKLGE